MALLPLSLPFLRAWLIRISLFLYRPVIALRTYSLPKAFHLRALTPCLSREPQDVKHSIVAVGSRSKLKAEEFVHQLLNQSPNRIQSYGSYEEVYADANVDIVYIATPHSEHCTNAIDALAAGKHVLVAKPVTLNTGELESILSLAKKNGRFFMEAMWTRFLPITRQIEEVMGEGKLGKVVHCEAAVGFSISGKGKDAPCVWTATYRKGRRRHY